MASSITSSNQPGSNLFNHQYRVRPTTVDQKRKLPRATKSDSKLEGGLFIPPRPSTTLENTATSSFTSIKNEQNGLVKDAPTESGENSCSEFVNPLNDSLNHKEKKENQIVEDFEKDSNAGSDDELDILNDEKWDTDIEEEVDEKTKDFTCEGIYLESCRKQKIIPASYFLRHLKDTEITLKHHGLGAPGIRPVSAALMNNNIVTKLDLSDNWLGAQGAEHIARMLKENCFISDLNLSDNHLTTKGCEALREILKTNTSLTHLTFQSNDFDDTTAEIWADIISSTLRIEYLDLSHNNFGEESGKILGAAIGENASIQHFNLSWNNIRRKGTMGIAKGLAVNSGIKIFNIGWNGLAQDGAKAFFKVIKENETLEEIDLSNNRIATEGAVFLGKGLQTNVNLKILRLGLNPMESAGCFAIIKALQKNPNSKIELLDFSEIIVDKFFQEEFKTFQTIFPNVAIKTGLDGVKLKPKVQIHPVLKLRNYFEKHHIKLIDFFTKFDKDNSMTVSRDEFRNGIKNLPINLSEEEIDLLIKELDPDNDAEISYSELRAAALI